jgi:hypothetical protein
MASLSFCLDAFAVAGQVRLHLADEDRDQKTDQRQHGQPENEGRSHRDDARQAEMANLYLDDRLQAIGEQKCQQQRHQHRAQRHEGGTDGDYCQDDQAGGDHPQVGQQVLLFNHARSVRGIRAT